MRSRASLFFSFFVLVACGGSSSTPSRDTSATSAGSFARDDATAILAKVSARYASAKTYADDGTYRIVYRETDGREKQTLTGRFTTRWRAPDRLVFVMKEDAASFHPPRTVSLSFVSDFDAHAVAESLANAHGESNGIAGIVPLWLVEGFRPPHGYELKGRWPCGERECHMLERFSDPTDKTMLFVDAVTFALRRVLRHTLVTPKLLDPETLAALPAAERERTRLRQVDPFVTDDDITFDPKFDEPIDF